MSDKEPKYCDLVMEGGGVKGIGLAGSLSALAESGYQVRRVAGTSAGAIIAALATSGMSMDDLFGNMIKLDYRKFRDLRWLDRLGPVGMMAALLSRKGVYRGQFMRNWLAKLLREQGIVTFEDLKITESWGKHLPPEQRYRLVVLTTDTTLGRSVRLPWDYHLYGLDPDKQKVADAVRASMSIPFFYEPARLRRSYCVDGGVLSNFPIELFDGTDDWPTFGIKLSAKPDAETRGNPPHNVLEFGEDLVTTILSAEGTQRLDDPCVARRTIFVDTKAEGVRATHFSISQPELLHIWKQGRLATERFLETWDFDGYRAACVDHSHTRYAKR